MNRLVPLTGCASGLALALALAAPLLHAQDGRAWHVDLAAGTVSSSNPPSRFVSGLGATLTAQLTRAVAPQLALRGEASWTMLPGRALGSPPQLTYPLAAACASTGCSYFPARTVHGSLGVAGTSAALVVRLPAAHGVREYLLAGGGAYRDYTVPRTYDGWSPGPVVTTGALELGYGMRFGASERLGVEVRGHRFAAGAVRWLVPLTLTFAL